ncbi:MAG: DUF423 domain-containing protein [Flavobacteriales bacterium]|nr:DUF423 domain-containing protein [Flavobacteriales bacterium]
MERRIIAWGAGILLVAVVLGAFGAHALKERLSPEHLGQWKTGVEYQFYHGLGLLLLAALGNRISDGASRRISWFFFLGVVLFSGSLYLLSTRELSGLGEATAIIGTRTSRRSGYPKWAMPTGTWSPAGRSSTPS